MKIILLYRISTDRKAYFMSKSYNEAKIQKSKYWKNKPVMKIDEKTYKSNQISTDVDLSRFKKDEFTNLPEDYEWNKIDVCDDTSMMNVANFLSIHYCRGTDSSYVIKYDPDRLRWEMSNAGYFLTVTDKIKHQIIGLIGFTYRT